MTSHRAGSEQKWFEVQARISVRADDENDAINRVAERLGHGGTQGIYPVAEFDARPVADPPFTPHRVKKTVKR